jgi:hypothetical protein
MQLAFSPSRWLLTGAVLAIFALSAPEVRAVPVDPISTELEPGDDLIDLDLDGLGIFNLEETIEDIDIPGPPGVLPAPPVAPAAPAVRKDLC